MFPSRVSRVVVAFHVFSLSDEIERPKILSRPSRSRDVLVLIDGTTHTSRYFGGDGDGGDVLGGSSAGDGVITRVSSHQQSQRNAIELTTKLGRPLTFTPRLNGRVMCFSCTHDRRINLLELRRIPGEGTSFRLLCHCRRRRRGRLRFPPILAEP